MKIFRPRLEGSQAARDTDERVMLALKQIAYGPYAFEYEHERFEECQNIARRALSGEAE